jgi:hypothetical protein
LNPEELTRILNEAMRETETRDRYLFENNGAERNIAARLAMSLQARLTDWVVDPDYNRMNGRHSKRVVLPPECAGYRNERDEALTSPDVIVHRRGPDGPNLLVIELKKTANPDKGDCDRVRLHAFREQLGHLYGALIQCETRRNREPAMVIVEWLS